MARLGRGQPTNIVISDNLFIEDAVPADSDFASAVDGGESIAATIAAGEFASAADARYPAGLVLDGSASTVITTPDVAAWNVSGVLRGVIRLKLADYTPPADSILLGHYEPSGNQLSWVLFLTTAGLLQFRASPDGVTSTVIQSSSALPVTDGSPAWLGFEYNTTTGALAFYAARDQPSQPTIWTGWDLVSSHTVAAVSLFDATTALAIGGTGSFFASLLTGTVYRAAVYDDGVLIASPDFTPTGSPQAVPGATTYTDSTGHVWTLRGNATIAGIGTAESISVGGDCDEPVTAVDSGEAIATGITDADTGAGVDAAALAAAPTDADTGVAVDGGEAIQSTNPSAADTGTAVDAESIASALSDADTGSGVDTEAVAPSVADADTGTGADANGTIALNGEGDTGAGVDAGTLAVALSDADTGSGAEAGTVATALADADTASGADAGEAIAVGTSDADTGAGVDAEGPLGISDADTGAGVDAGESIAAALTDSDTATAVDDGNVTALGLAPSDTDAGTALEDGTIAVVTSDADTAAVVDGESLAAAIADLDAAAGVDAESPLVVAISDTDSATAADAEAISSTGLSDDDSALAAELEAIASAFADADFASAADGEHLATHLALTDGDTGAGVDAGESLDAQFDSYVVHVRTSSLHLPEHESDLAVYA